METEGGRDKRWRDKEIQHELHGDEMQKAMGDGNMEVQCGGGKRWRK